MSLVRALRPTHEVGLLLRVLGISRSTYYHWEARAADPSRHARDDAALTVHIHRIWEDSGRTYGADRVWGRLRRDGIGVGRKRIERLMRSNGWQGAYRPPKTSGAWKDPNAVEVEDLVRRQFTATAPDRLWLADASWIPTRDGGVWVAAIKDVFAGTIVGWSTGRTCDTDLIERALDYALVTRDHRPEVTVHHSDRGSNYTSLRFSKTLEAQGIRQSLGSVGDSYDNAMMESFWSTLKVELIERQTWETAEQLENRLFLYVDTWYNPKRIQKRLAYHSPLEYEQLWAAGALPAVEGDVAGQ